MTATEPAEPASLPSNDSLQGRLVRLEPFQREHVPALQDLAARLQAVPWQAADIAAEIKAILRTHGLKMPQLAKAVRVLVFGTPNTPSLDAMLALSEREKVLQKLRQV